MRLKRKDAFWLIPAAALTGELLHRDAYLYQKLTPNVNPGTTSKSFSDYGVVALAGGVGGMYLLGRMHGDDHARETGVLGAEAVLDSLALSSALKYTLRRQRPFDGNGRGDFFTSGGDSFPSDHAIVAWSAASVIAHEYPGPLTKIGVYGLATAVSLARVTGRQHFPTDVVIGSALGYGIGTLVYKRHHDENMPGSDIGRINYSAAEPTAGGIGSVHVPLESWVYPAIDRLAARGFVASAFSASRPWTRMECARLTQEAETLLSERTDDDGNAESKIIASLRDEFSLELGQLEDGAAPQSIRLESVYTRFTGVSGPPLNDEFHFGETIYNNYGRPITEGFNSAAGFSGSATRGHLAVYVRGEYQHAASAPALPASAINAIAAMDQIPASSAMPFNDISRLRFLDAYVGFTFKGWEASFGKQSLWWGPGEDSAFMFSNNAEPLLMLRIARAVPASIPGISKLLGPMRAEFILGQTSGQEFVRIHPDAATTVLFGPNLVRQPFIQAGRLSFKPTPNFEFSVSASTLFGGPGFPITTKTFLRTLSFGNGDPGFANDPGDRRSSFDFKYRIPGLRNSLTLYADAFAEDLLSPLENPRHSAVNPGLYLSRFPGVPRLDFRAEGIYTDVPNYPQGNFYSNTSYLSGWTNQGHILGSWIGRNGTGLNFKSSYWFSAQRRLSLGYRDVSVGPVLLAGGGRIQDASVNGNWNFNKDLEFTAGVQYERWNFPVLGPRETNIASTVQITFHPWRRSQHK